MAQAHTGTRQLRPIGQPIIFHDGIATNHKHSSCRGSSANSLQDSSMAAETSKSATLVNCDDEHSLFTLQNGKNAICNEASTEKESQLETYAPDAAFLPPRHRRPRNRDQDEGREGRKSLTVDRNIVSLFGLSLSITDKDLYDAVLEMGFTAHVIKAVNLQPNDHSASLEFSHSHLASAAFSIFRRSKNAFWVEPCVGASASNLVSDSTSRQTEPEVIDLTKEPTFSSVPPRLDDLYGNLSRTIYDDSASDSESDTNHPSPERILSPRAAHSPDSNHTDRLENIHAHLTRTFELPPRSGLGSNRAIYPAQRARKVARGRSIPRSALPSTSLPILSADEPKIHVVAIPKSPYNHARRVLLPETANMPIMTVSMRADVQFFHRSERHRISSYSMPNNSEYVVGYGEGPFQISLVRLIDGRSPSLIDLSHTPHKRSIESGPKTGNAAVSCLAAQCSNQEATQFFTGGYDKTIRLWSVTTPESITIRKLTTLTTIPEALASRGRTLLVGTSRKILKVDLGHLSRRPEVTQMSNAIHQIHVHNQAPNITILVVDHLDFQIQLFDDRKKRGFDRVADCYFGGRYGNAPARCTRGDTNFSLFVKGYEDGTVCVWDYRNVKQPVLTKKQRSVGPLVHTIFFDSEVICYSRHSLTFLDISNDEF